MAARYNPPPNWPDQPAGWTPPPEWEPDPSWGPPPYGWQLWLEDSAAPRTIQRRHLIVAVGFVIGIGALLGYVYLFSARSDNTSTMTSDPDTPAPPRMDARAGTSVDRVVAGSKADQKPAPGATEPHKTATPPAPASHRPAPSGGTGPAAPSHPATSTSTSTSTPMPDRHGSSGPGPHRQLPRSGDRLDPRFNDCGEARAAGYGPYHAGHDLEYFWYPDLNRDGTVCGVDESVAGGTDAGNANTR